jgi:hypothetical protein
MYFLRWKNSEKDKGRIEQHVSKLSDGLRTIRWIHDNQVMPEPGGQQTIKWKGLIKLHLLTEDADTCLIKEVLYPLTCATVSAIWTRDTLSGPPTFKSNFICLPSRTSTTNIRMIGPDPMSKHRGKQAAGKIKKYNANKEIPS